MPTQSPGQISKCCLARRTRSSVRALMCQLSETPIETVEKGFWGRVPPGKNRVKTVACASAFCFVLRIDPSIALGIVPVSASVDLFIAVGEEIDRD